jgi:hypothetical protein
MDLEEQGCPMMRRTAAAPARTYLSLAERFPSGEISAF